MFLLVADLNRPLQNSGQKSTGHKTKQKQRGGGAGGGGVRKRKTERGERAGKERGGDRETHRDRETGKLQALGYDILPWRKVPESDARSVRER